jgi:hypothetical protein
MYAMITCESEEARAAWKRLGAGALAGWSAAGPAFVAGRTSTGVAALDSSLWCREEARLAASGGVAGRSRGRDGWNQ